MTREMKKILVTGALGQIGSELTLALRSKYGNDNVIATDIRTDDKNILSGSGPFQILDVKDPDAIEAIIQKYNIDSAFHLAAILSGVGEKDPILCWTINMTAS